jgi:hypothetical protein
MKHQPRIKFIFGLCESFPDGRSPKMRVTSKEPTTIVRGHRVITIRGPYPNDSIFFISKLNTRDGHKQ